MSSELLEKGTKPALLTLEARVSRTVIKRDQASSSWARDSRLTYCQKKGPSQLFLGLETRVSAYCHHQGSSHHHTLRLVLMSSVLSAKKGLSQLFLGSRARVSRTIRKRDQASSSWARDSCLTYYQKKGLSQLFLGSRARVSRTIRKRD